MMRIGHGYDVHRFCSGDSVILGGVNIPHDKALEAHSDGDVLLHALTDAILGAAAMGDIGKHFPDTDAVYKDANSRELLRHVVNLVTAKGYCIGNADMTIIAQSPRVSTFTDAMRANIAEEFVDQFRSS